jgi:hypothetical protein
MVKPFETIFKAAYQTLPLSNQVNLIWSKLVKPFETCFKRTLMLSSLPSLFDFATAMGSNDKSSSASGTPCSNSMQQQQRQHAAAATTADLRGNMQYRTSPAVPAALPAAKSMQQQ